ncbi:hypothetical protein WJX81_002025, partial [Elliptochloris bilobata]
SLDDVEAAAQPGGPLGPGGAHALTPRVRFSLQHRGDLLVDCPAADVAEMEAAVLATFNRVAGEGWQIVRVGGAMRGEASHDADFVVWHPTRSPEGAVHAMSQDLMKCGRLFPPSQAMCQIQAGLMPTRAARMRLETVAKWHGEAGRMLKHPATTRREAVHHMDRQRTLPNLASDRFDHLFGMFRTEADAVRRLDVIIATFEERAFCILGWTGTRQFLRFMRSYAADVLGMHLNAHGLMRVVGRNAFFVPMEKPPLNCAGQEGWPPGWHKDRPVTCEADIFELLNLPYRPPHERQAP